MLDWDMEGVRDVDIEMLRNHTFPKLLEGYRDILKNKSDDIYQKCKEAYNNYKEIHLDYYDKTEEDWDWEKYDTSFLYDEFKKLGYKDSQIIWISGHPLGISKHDSVSKYLYLNQGKESFAAGGGYYIQEFLQILAKSQEMAYEPFALQWFQAGREERLDILNKASLSKEQYQEVISAVTIYNIGLTLAGDPQAFNFAQLEQHSKIIDILKNPKKGDSTPTYSAQTEAINSLTSYLMHNSNPEFYNEILSSLEPYEGRMLKFLVYGLESVNN